MSFTIVFRPTAERDLDGIYDHIAYDSPARAIDLVRRIRSRCRDLSDFPLAGRLRADLSPDVRTIALERRVLIAYVVFGNAVEIVRVLYGGRDVDALLREGD